MSIAGVRSNRGDSYQTVVAIEWVVSMLLDESIVAIEVDTTALVDEEPADVDDIVIKFADGRSHYFQCKKNEKNFEAWTAKSLASEFVNAANLLSREVTANVTFYSRSNFGSVAKLREHAQTQPDHAAFIKSLTPALLAEHQVLCASLGGSTNDSQATLSLLLRIEFETTGTVERIQRKNKATLARHLTNAEAAHSAIWTAVDQLGARIVRANGSIHSITRSDLVSILESHGCHAKPNVLGGRFATDAFYDENIPPAARQSLTEHIDAYGNPEQVIDQWKARYEALVQKLNAQRPDSDLHHAGQALANGDYTQAEKHLDAAIRIGEENARTLGVAYSNRGELHLLKFEQQDALHNFRLAWLSAPDNADFVTNYSSLLIELVDFSEAINVLTKAIASPPDDATSALWRCTLATALFSVGKLKESQAMFTTAEKYFATAKYSSAEERADVINGLYINRGLMYESLDLQTDALRCYQTAVTHFREALKVYPSTQQKLALVQALNNLALHCTTAQDSEEPGKLYREARSLLVGDCNWKSVKDLALISVNYADYLIAKDDFEQAGTLLNESLVIRRNVLQKSGWHPSASYDLCDCLLTLATFQYRSGNTRKALAIVEETRAQAELLRTANPGLYGKILARFLTNVTVIYRNNGQFDDALDCADEAVRFFRQQAVTETVLKDLATALNNKANVLMEMGEVQVCGETHEEAITIRRELAKSGNHGHLCEYALSLAGQAVLLSDEAFARKNLDEAGKILSELVIKDPQAYIVHWCRFLNNDCLERIRFSNFEHAIRSGLEAVNEFKRLIEGGAAQHTNDLASSLCNLSIAYEHHGQVQQAVDCLIESKKIYEALALKGDPRFLVNLAKVHENLCFVYLTAGNRPAALEAKRQAIAGLVKVQASADQSFKDYINVTIQRINRQLPG
jgi:tetratricopeptide (TPR) repeat protein